MESGVTILKSNKVSFRKKSNTGNKGIIHNDKNINPPIKHASNSRASNMGKIDGIEEINKFMIMVETSVLPAGTDKTNKHKIIKYYRGTKQHYQSTKPE